MPSVKIEPCTLLEDEDDVPTKPTHQCIVVLGEKQTTARDQQLLPPVQFDQTGANPQIRLRSGNN